MRNSCANVTIYCGYSDVIVYVSVSFSFFFFFNFRKKTRPKETEYRLLKCKLVPETEHREFLAANV